MKFQCLWRKSNVLAFKVSDIYVFVFVNWLILQYILEIMEIAKQRLLCIYRLLYYSELFTHNALQCL